MLDLFCGRGGATKGFMAEGWTCVGVDLNPQPDYPSQFRQADVLAYSAGDLREFDFVWASSPCEEFSVHCMKHFHPNPKFPEIGIRLFEHTRNICENSGVPYVMENVRCAQKFVGPAVNHCGPFYLWGNAVPAIMPKDLYRITKGLDCGAGMYFGGSNELLRKHTIEEVRAIRRAERKKSAWQNTSSKSAARKEVTAKAAEIPVALSRYIAQCATRSFISDQFLEAALAVSGQKQQ